jgi:transketolase
VSGAYAAALEFHGPTVLALTRQALPHLAGSSIDGCLKGAYTVAEVGAQPPPPQPTLVFIASGSEVSLALAAAAALHESGDARFAAIRVVSAPSLELLAAQPVAYRRALLPPGVACVSIEALTTFGWAHVAHHHIGMRSFGVSAPGAAAMDAFGFTQAKVAAQTRAFLDERATQCAAMGVPAAFGPLPTHF